jgi:Kef-type K+ transport system membrane component KefB
MPSSEFEDVATLAIPPKRLRGVLTYGLMLVAAMAAYMAIRHVGESAGWSPGHVPSASKAAESTPRSGQPVDVVFHVLATLAMVIGLGHCLGRVFRWIGQPPVIGEVVAGICLGPSLLGAISPDLMHSLIPTAATDPHGQVTAALKMIAQLGVILYMFVVGLDLNAAKLKSQAHSLVAISHMSIVAPFLLGAVLALWLHRDYAPPGTTFTSFSLFVGVAMSITAFPVLARILTDRCLESTRLGMMALACAAADDATAWCLLAIVVGIVQAKVGSAITVAISTIAFIACMSLVVRPLMESWCARLERRTGPLPVGVMIVATVCALLASLTTEMIGIHAIFGAFLLGAIIPHDSQLGLELKLRLRDSVTILLLPAFFAYTGMRMQVGLVSGWQNVLACIAIIFVATLGKFGGTVVAARWTGIGWRDSMGLGTLMNTRGLMELIVLNIGLDLGVISPTLFAMMVLMALATTIATSPILARLIPEFCSQEERMTAGRLTGSPVT